MKIILIDSSHKEETRVALLNQYTNQIEKYESEITKKTQIKGNIYLARVIRIEPSLQAAFVEYDDGKVGFLSFSEIHPDYCQIPVNDKEELENHIKTVMANHIESEDFDEEQSGQIASKLRYQFYRRYKIQEVIKKRQVFLVQVVREERGNKGASLTTYITLIGKYCILMVNANKALGISRKITNITERKKLKKILETIEVPVGMSLVVRSAGVGKNKLEIKKDLNFLLNIWDGVRKTTVNSIAPSLIHEEANIVKRAIRDIFTKGVEHILIEGEKAYKNARDFMKKISLKDVKNVKLYKEKQSLFAAFDLNRQIESMYNARVELPSGGYLIINPTEALVSIDVNSGKSIKERNILETAYKTNIEAAFEIAKQCQLRDLAGLIVVDFIDMTDGRYRNGVEKALREALKMDKAKIQISGISQLGLLEFSRQRLSPSILEKSMTVCKCCGGSGVVLTIEIVALQILRGIEEVCLQQSCDEIIISTYNDVFIYLFNHKRNCISDLENRYDIKITMTIDNEIIGSTFKIEPILTEIHNIKDVIENGNNPQDKDFNDKNEKIQIGKKENIKENITDIKVNNIKLNVTGLNNASKINENILNNHEEVDNDQVIKHTYKKDNRKNNKQLLTNSIDNINVYDHNVSDNPETIKENIKENAETFVKISDEEFINLLSKSKSPVVFNSNIFKNIKKLKITKSINNKDLNVNTNDYMHDNLISDEQGVIDLNDDLGVFFKFSTTSTYKELREYSISQRYYKNNNLNKNNHDLNSFNQDPISQLNEQSDMLSTIETQQQNKKQQSESLELKNISVETGNSFKKINTSINKTIDVKTLVDLQKKSKYMQKKQLSETFGFENDSYINFAKQMLLNSGEKNRIKKKVELKNDLELFTQLHESLNDPNNNATQGDTVDKLKFANKAELADPFDLTEVLKNINSTYMLRNTQDLLSEQSLWSINSKHYKLKPEQFFNTTENRHKAAEQDNTKKNANKDEEK